jgi:hypothetical protein
MVKYLMRTGFATDDALSLIGCESGLMNCEWRVREKP